MPALRVPSRALAAAALIVIAAPGSSTASDATNAARAYVAQNQQSLGLTDADLAELTVSSEVKSRHNGVTHVYLQQRYGGIDVHAALMTVSIGRNGAVLSATGRFVSTAAAGPGSALTRAE